MPHILGHWNRARHVPGRQRPIRAQQRLVPGRQRPVPARQRHVPARPYLVPAAFADLHQLRLKASSLAVLHQAALAARLLATTNPTLIDDLDRRGVVVPNARQGRHEARAATADQNAALDAGYARIKAVRAAVKKAGVATEVPRAYGVGQLVKATLVRDVTAMLQQILDRATANPDEAASLGIVQKISTP